MVDGANSVTTDDAGNIYMTGYFTSGTLTFGTITLTSANPSECYVAKYDKDGKVTWVLTSSGQSNIQAKSVSLDDDGNVYLTGNLSQPVDFGSAHLTDNGILLPGLPKAA
jgi:secreted PhoX family phosphatase